VWSPTARWSAHSPTNPAASRADSSAANPHWLRSFADVAAAMLVAGNGRGRLSDAGWDALDAAMADDAGPGTDSPVIH
jgi:hypothetical protein